MSGKDNKPSKKAVKEKQKKAIEESTFGLKNKNKSKKVQQFINRVEKSVKHSNGGLEASKTKELKKEAKLAKQLQEEEMRQLFNEAIGNQFGVKKSKAQTNAAMLGLTTVKKEVVDFLDGLSTDSSDDEEEEDRVAGVVDSFVDDEPVAVEIFREKTIEDIIEEQRAKLAAEGKKGTPVTEESFAKWRAEKLAKKQADAEARLKAEQMKKKGGKGLSVLSGKELFSYNAALFIDDESAFDTTSDRAINDEIKALAQIEEDRIREETNKAQAEQLRLFELQQFEIQARKDREEAKRQRACAPGRKTFVFCGVVVNQAVFEEEEEEDLEFFTDLPLPTPKSSSGAGEVVSSESIVVETLEQGLQQVQIADSAEDDNNADNGSDQEDDEEGDDENQGDSEDGED
mmetsp:Transcript_7286/g.7986  ORF Transcript_7286/g.7986 Transcript_7286/m.7986 type:complete len:401 (+) Transcript_7286:118-1320(+)|eukprot:CAMPEP_0173151228 /NCGR_PEP_ID=MMETSP1105-20130129/11447_1 /TAXON_ID=2985 /ORGANISM="Ochromonas sp., Strain BG-1" /LENGTH=400 /DNA_ID=CAMNT_0014066547 /DNA_START=104 /DNA_END=1306 /DNA_ORIENTATION=+